MQNGKAHLMLSRSARPMNPEVQDLLFYRYAAGVAAYRDALIARGVKVSPITYPGYMLKASFGLTFWTDIACWSANRTKYSSNAEPDARFAKSMRPHPSDRLGHIPLLEQADAGNSGSSCVDAGARVGERNATQR